METLSLPLALCQGKQISVYSLILLNLFSLSYHEITLHVLSFLRNEVRSPEYNHQRDVLYVGHCGSTAIPGSSGPTQSLPYAATETFRVRLVDQQICCELLTYLGIVVPYGIIIHNEVVGGYNGFTPSVRPSVRLAVPHPVSTL